MSSYLKILVRHPLARRDPLLYLNGAWGVGVGWMDWIGLREGWNHVTGSSYAS